MQKSRALAETTTQQLEAFSDGIFSIAITLLVLEIRVPQVQATEGTTNSLGLASALFALWPSYFAYIFSFVMIGIFWATNSSLTSLANTRQVACCTS